MDETTKRGLIKTTEAAIRQAKIELENLQAFKAWVMKVGTAATGSEVTVFGVEPEQRTTADYIEEAFGMVGSHASLTIPEILQGATDLGWTTDSANPEQVIRTTISRMGTDGKIQAAPVVNPNEQRRFRIIQQPPPVRIDA